MTEPNPYLWPKGSTLVVRDRTGEICRSSRRKFDLADGIMLKCETRQRTVSLAILLQEPPTKDISPALEELIRYDLGFDGYGVTIARQEPQDALATYEWSLRIRARF